MSPESRRQSLDALNDLNRIQQEAVGDPEIATRIASYEMAYRMQTSVPELLDLAGETKDTLEMYGAEPGKASFANNCVLARRLVERGVRTVQLYHRGWDSHGSAMSDDIMHSLPDRCRETDQACAALIKDLKQRGMLDSTLVVWGGEFGRTPMNEARMGSTFLGRDHHPHCFTMWFAGGGIKPGITLGETDELGYRVVRDPVHVHDLHATMLHLMGLDHKRLTYRFQGRDFRLTDVHGELVSALLA
jgi:arylsulfatase A-like enzyme